MALVILTGGAVLNLRGGAHPAAPGTLFYATLALAFVVSLGFAALLRYGHPAAAGPLGDLQLITDVAVTTLLVYSTGAQDSVLTFLYPLNTLYAAPLVSRPAGYAVAASGAACLAGVVALSVVGVLPRPDEPGMSYEQDAVGVVTATAGANFLVAMLGGQLSDQLRASAQTLRQTRLDLQTQQALNTAMVHSLKSGLLSVDGDGRVQVANPSALVVLGRAMEDVAWRPVEEVLQGALPRPGGASVERTYTLPDGTQRVVDVSVEELRNTPRPGAVVTLEDVTDQRRLEAAMALSQRLASVGQFAAGLAHELRNPLGSMIGCVELLQQSTRASQDADGERLLSIIHREAERLAALVQEFLVYARPQPPNLQPVDLLALLLDVAEGCNKDPELGATVRVASNQPLTIQADAAQIRQVLLNLVQNAAHVSPPGEPVVLRVDRDTLGVQAAATITVEDRGPGVVAEVAARLFEPFFTTNPQGTGLGLAIVHRITEAHGGMVGLKRPGGPGAVFTVTLPVAPPPRVVSLVPLEPAA